MSTLDIAAYRFVPLPDPGAWRDAVHAAAEARGLKGTVLLAPEGINLFLAGNPDGVEGFLRWLAADVRFVDRTGRPAFAALEAKRSTSSSRHFRRLRVRLRPEIVTTRRPAIRPSEGRAPSVDPERLDAWLEQGHDDEGRPLVLLDARNAFEVEMGSFDGATHLALGRFESFPDEVETLREAVAGRTVATYCTGGIRCEKAALSMQGRASSMWSSSTAGSSITSSAWAAATGAASASCSTSGSRSTRRCAHARPDRQRAASAASSSAVNPASRRAARLNGPRRRGAS